MFFGVIDYLKSQNDIDKKTLDKADSIEKFISQIETKYESNLKEK